MNEYRNLYIHVPFCRKKCDYCAFYSESACTRDQQLLWLEKVIRQLQEYAPALRHVHTVYLGGGTPSLLPPDLLEQLFQAIRDHAGLEEHSEITMEANPETVTEELCHTAAGFINRVSMGVQSFSPRLLAAAGRRSGAEYARPALDLWHKHGITNCGFDLISSLPGETMRDLEEDLTQAVSCGIQHLSVYSLMVEEGTPLARRGVTENPDLAAEMWEFTGQFAAAHGMPRYEISNYASPAFEARHNQNVWHGETYLGLGPAASGFDGTDRVTQVASLKRWAEGEAPERDVIPRPERLREIFLMGLRTVRGWTREEFRQATGEDCEFPELETLIREGFLQSTEQGIRATEQGLAFWNEIGMRLL